TAPLELEPRPTSFRKQKKSWLLISSHLQTFPSDSPNLPMYPQSRTGLAYPGVTHMSTLRQIEANRRNAQKSTGPTSVTGKAASSMNALKSGIHAKSLVLPSEKLADLEQLIDDYYQRHNPDSPEARLYLDEVIHCEWLLRRYRTTETQMWQYQAQSAYADEQKYPLGKSATGHATPFSKLQ